MFEGQFCLMIGCNDCNLGTNCGVQFFHCSDTLKPSALKVSGIHSQTYFAFGLGWKHEAGFVSMGRYLPLDLKGIYFFFFCCSLKVRKHQSYLI